MLNKEKLNAKSVGIASHSDPQTKGITLIALIITIIVMLILVGVTINVALNGGLFGKANEAAKQMEEKTIYEQIVGAIQLTNAGKIDVKGTYEAAKADLESQGKTVTQKFPSTEITDSTTSVIFNVKGKKETYTYTITTEETIIGTGGKIINNFGITVEKTYDISTNKLKLKITPTVSESIFTEDEAVSIAIEYIKSNGGNNVETYEDVIVFFANMSSEENTYADYDSLQGAIASEMGIENPTKDNPSKQEVFAYLTGEPEMTIQKMIAYTPTMFAKVMVNGEMVEEENLDRHETYIKYEGILQKGEYNIQLKLGNKVASEKIEVGIEYPPSNPPEIKDYVYYDVTAITPNDGGLTEGAAFLVIFEDFEICQFLSIFGKDDLFPLPFTNLKFVDDYDNNGTIIPKAILKGDKMINPTEWTLYGWISSNGNLIAAKEETGEFIELSKQIIPTYTKQFIEIYDTEEKFDGTGINKVFGLLEGGKCYYMYTYRNLDFIFCNGPVNYRIEDEKLYIEETDNNGLGTGTYKEYTIGTDAIKRSE